MNSPLADLRFFLGGRDLEMVTIRELLERHAPGQYLDRGLSWGAKASAYAGPIAESLAEGKTVVLVELPDDLGLLDGPDGARIIAVDHHGHSAGQDRPTALEQVYQLLRLPPNAWTRWHALVAANDRGHVRALQTLGATREEIERVRAADRAAQGITPDQETVGRRSAAQAQTRWDGALTVVELPHERTATVTDALEPPLGGPGYQNLLVLCPDMVMFYGEGAAIDALRATWPDGFYGGELPARGFWGYPEKRDREQLLAILAPVLARSSAPHVMPAEEYPR